MSPFLARGLLIASAWAQAYATRPATSTAVSEPSSKVDSLAYRIFDGLHMNLHYCLLQKGGQDEVHNLSWSPVTATLPWLSQPGGVKMKYAFVPGSFFHDDARTDAGFCYKSEQTSVKPICVCGNLTLTNSPKASDEKVEGQLDFTGCDHFVKPGPTVADSPVEVFFSGEAKAEVMWSHPESLWIQAQVGQWCETKAILPDKVDNSIGHGLPYCIVANKIETEDDFNKLDVLRAHMYWAMCFDQKHPSNWFRADTMEYQSAWNTLCNHFPDNWNTSVRDNLNRHQQDSIFHAGTLLCRKIRLAKPKMTAELSNVYDTYMKGQQGLLAKHGASQASGGPLVLFATGPPSSGKSLSSMSIFDFDLITNKTASLTDPLGAFKGRSFEDLTKNTVEINLDRILESTDLLDSQKLHSRNFVRWTENTNTAADGDALVRAQQRSQEDGQKDYWFLRKGAHLDDLSNAHTQLLLGLGKDVIYETLLNSPRWILDFDIPKMKAAGYMTVVVNYVVPVSELVQRAFDREKRTGQTPAPAKQIEADAKASPTNFMKPEFLRQINYGVSLSHVRKGKVEDALAVYRNPLEGTTVGCFSYCAADDVIEKYNVRELKRCNYAKCEDSVANSKPSFLLETGFNLGRKQEPHQGQLHGV